MRNLGHVLLAGSLCASAIAGEASAQERKRETLVVRRDAHGSSRMTVYWKESVNQDNGKEYLVGLDNRTIPIPRRYFVGTETRSGRLSMHVWMIQSGFLDEASARGGLQLARKMDQNECPSRKNIVESAGDYNNNSSIPQLLSAIIEFGHIYEVCTKKGLPRNATVSGNVVDGFYAMLKRRLPSTFFGEMCRSDLLVPSCT